jgi:hypothetical protein
MRERNVKNYSINTNVSRRDERGANEAEIYKKRETTMYAHHLLLQLHKAANAEGLHYGGGVKTGRLVTLVRRRGTVHLEHCYTRVAYRLAGG